MRCETDGQAAALAAATAACTHCDGQGTCPYLGCSLCGGNGSPCGGCDGY